MKMDKILNEILSDLIFGFRVLLSQRWRTSTFPEFRKHRHGRCLSLGANQGRESPQIQIPGPKDIRRHKGSAFPHVGTKSVSSHNF